ncbi:MAG: signal peptidase II [Candidatus Nanoarchaeia archaeon]|nr:signal peptidase II [Candidatus Nanoarchaeia archaeon]
MTNNNTNKINNNKINSNKVNINKINKNKYNNEKRYVFFIFTSIFLLFIDLFLKSFTKNINNYIIRPVKNYGISLGILNKYPLIISILSIIFLSYMIYIFLKNREIIFKNKILFISSILIFSGAVSNTFDRIFLGYVRDYIYMYFFVNNLADIYISVAILLFFIFYKSKENKFKENKSIKKG